MELTNLNKDRKNRRKPSLDLSTMVYGKVPPQSKELEEAILGATMIDRGAIIIIKEILKPEHFYVDAHQRIFRVISAMDEANKSIDILTVVEELKASEELDIVGGPYAVTTLTKNVVSTANIEAHARIVFQKWMQRHVIQISGELINDAYEDAIDAFDLVDTMVKRLDEVVNNFIPKQVSYPALVHRTLQNILNLEPGKIRGVRSGFASLDSIIDFFIDGLFYVIAARPSMGKTSFMVQLVDNLSKDCQTPIGIIQMETHDEAFVQRQFANVSKTNSRKYKNGGMTNEEKQTLMLVADELMKRNIVCDFYPTSTISQVRIKIKRWKQLHNIKIVLIDYLQFIESDNIRLPRERQVALMSKGLASLAKELGIPIIAFAQLSREVYKRADKRPLMSDLRESGSIEQDARCVMFLHRPEFYGETSDPLTGQPNTGVTEVIVSKNNEGDTGTAHLKMIKEQSRFTELHDVEIEGKYSFIKIGSKLKTDEEFDDGIEEVPQW